MPVTLVPIIKFPEFNSSMTRKEKTLKFQEMVIKPFKRLFEWYGFRNKDGSHIGCIFEINKGQLIQNSVAVSFIDIFNDVTINPFKATINDYKRYQIVFFFNGIADLRTYDNTKGKYETIQQGSWKEILSEVLDKFTDFLNKQSNYFNAKIHQIEEIRTQL